MEKLLKKSEIPDDLLEYFEEVTPQTVPCTVLDIFGGAMTSAIVSYKHGRYFKMIELSEAYIQDIGIPRIEQETQQFKLPMVGV